MVLKEHVKLFRYVRRKKRVSVAVLDRKFDRSTVHKMISLGYLSCGSVLPQDAEGYPIGDYPPDSLIALSDSGRAETEAHDWFAC